MKRIVRMTLKNEDALQAFQNIYAKRNPYKNGVAGCLSVEILRDINESNICYTLSEWETNEALEEYRNSAYFKQTWPMVKALLSKRAEAYSLETLTMNR